MRKIIHYEELNLQEKKTKNLKGCGDLKFVVQIELCTLL